MKTIKTDLIGEAQVAYGQFGRIRRDIDRGFRRFCARRGLDFPELKETINAEIASAKKRKGKK